MTKIESIYDLKVGDEILMIHNWLINYMKVIHIPKRRRQYIKVSLGGDKVKHPCTYEPDASKHTIQKWVLYNGNVLLIKRDEILPD